MRLDDYRTSDNVEDQRGSGGGFRFGGGGGGLPFGGGKLSLGGIAIIIVISLIMGVNPLELLGGGGGAPVATQRAAPATPEGAKQACAVDTASRFSCQVLANAEDTWAKIFAEHGAQFTPATLSFYAGSGRSGCGAAQSAMGPFYCPSDNGIYLDTDFFNDLATKFGAAGDFAQAYVIAHEYGHHIQTIDGTSDKVRQAQSRASEAEGNAYQVKMELQADCYAGVWAKRNADRIEPGDIEEGLRAAQSIGDDTLQKAAGRRPVPESFTHGTSAQRMTWLKRGLDSGDPAQCNTFG